MKEEELWAQERLALKTSLEEVRLEALRVRSPMFTKGNWTSVTVNCETFRSSVVSSKMSGLLCSSHWNDFKTALTGLSPYSIKACQSGSDQSSMFVGPNRIQSIYRVAKLSPASRLRGWRSAARRRPSRRQLPKSDPIYSQAVSGADSFLTQRKMKAGVAPVPQHVRKVACLFNSSLQSLRVLRVANLQSIWMRLCLSMKMTEMRITCWNWQAQARAAELSRRQQEQNDHIESLKADLFSTCRKRMSRSLSSSHFLNQGIRRKPSWTRLRTC